MLAKLDAAPARGGETDQSGGRNERASIRALMIVLLLVSLVVAATVHPPEKLPSVALHKQGVYKLEIGLAVFYGALLVITPAVLAISRGKLPTEISTRGFKVSGSDVQANEAMDEKVQKIATRLAGVEKRIGDL